MPLNEISEHHKVWVLKQEAQDSADHVFPGEWKYNHAGLLRYFPSGTRLPFPPDVEYC